MQADGFQPTTASTSRYGEVFDRGYQHYHGERLGRSGAIKALIGYSIRRALGIKKKWTAKIIPFLLYAAAFLPTIIIIGIRAFIAPRSQQIAAGFNYSTLYTSLSVILLIFAAMSAPEMLCDDRRENTLALYFSRPITRTDYVISKVAALGILMSTLALIPALILFLANTLLASSPLQYLSDNAGDIWRIIVTGIVLSIFYAAIGLVIAAFTNRKGIAAAIYIGLILIEGGVVEAIYSAMNSSNRDYLALIDLAQIPTGIYTWLLGTNSTSSNGIGSAALKGWTYLIPVAVVLAFSYFVMHQRYLMEQ